MVKSVFDGIKVADFTWALAGALTTKHLADYGATVIKVESAAKPGALRTSQPYKDNKPGVNRSGYFAYFNGNKYDISIDLNHPKGIEVAKSLISWSDVVAENFRPGLMKRWGLDYENIKTFKPDIIMLSTSNQGQTGPYSGIAGYGNHLNGMTGLIHFTGWPDREPVSMMLAYTDYNVPQLATATVVAALDYRRRTGKGQYLDLSQFEAGVEFFSPAILDFTVNARESERAGNSCDYAAPHGAYRCDGDDRWCVIAIFNDTQWKALSELMGNPNWTNEPKFSTLTGRKENEDELNRLIEAWTINFTAEDLMDRLQDRRIPSGIVKSTRDIAEDPQLHYRNLWWKLNHREIGPFNQLGQASILSKTPAEGRMPAPCLGEHTEYVCVEILGMSDSEFLELLTAGAFGEW